MLSPRGAARKGDCRPRATRAPEIARARGGTRNSAVAR